MRLVHYFTARGPICDPTERAGSLSVVVRSVTCPACLAALEERDQEDLRWSARGVRSLARIRLIAADE